MSVKKTDREQIDKYLKGKLDARAMHKLERQAQDDPFLMDALEGYEAAGEQDANLSELKELLAQRIAPKKERSILLWRVLPIAACLLIALMTGYWYFAPKPVKQQYAAVVKPEKTTTVPAEQQPVVITKPKDAGANRFTQSASKTQPVIPQPNKTLATVSVAGTNNITYKTDTVEYRASDYKVRENSTVNELLKHMEGFRVDSNGNVSANGQAVTKARLNGKDYAGGDIKQAIQSLPADVIQKIQVVDDYGDQAARTGVKDGDPTKVLNITTDSSKRRLVAANDKAKVPVLKEVKLNDKSVAAAAPAIVDKEVESKVAGVTINRDIHANSSYHTITGIVLDEKGQPLIGAGVKIDGEKHVIATDVRGNFKIDVPANNETLDVSSLGYVSKQVKVSGQENVKVALDANQNSLNEVAVVGYGTQVKKEITGSATGTDAQPAIGIKAYDAYLKENAVMPDNTTGTVELSFIIAADGTINNIRVISGKNKVMNDKAIDILKNGPKWIAGSMGKETRLKVVFRKKN